nr:GNAT family N-acetyltransferase [Deinococcus aestuarii]
MVIVLSHHFGKEFAATMAEGSVARQPDLLTCDDEPIHIPGAIQPHGLLLALAADMTIVAGSDNLPELTGLAIGALIGRSAADVFDSETHNRLTIALAEPGAAVGAPITVGFTMRKDAGFIGSWHRHDQLIFLELEPPQRDVAEPQAFFRRTNSAIRRLQAAETLESACAAAAQEVRKITGFDRVMIYRFASDFSGVVIAEDRCAEVESKLGLHYPASAVPAQARRLYTINPVRIIPDINYRPVPVTPDLNPVTGRPIDLSFAILRSVSPCHLEFMRNIGMHGTMSISILRGERLWGLIVCHHRTPYYVDLDGRQACELVAQVLAWQIGVMEEAAAEGRGSLLTCGDVEENPGPSGMTEYKPTVRLATRDDVPRAVRTLAAAFADYPATRHTVDPDRHIERVTELQELFLTRVGLDIGKVWVADDGAAVAVWTTPESVEAGAVFAEIGPRMAELSGSRLAAQQQMEGLLAPHRPKEPAWFLATVGVSPDHQGKGLGSAVVLPGVEAAERAGVPAFLETSAPRNLPFYERLGFTVTADVEVPEGPRTWCMTRKPGA